MRVLLVDDQRLFREGLCALLRAGGNIEVVGQAANAREAYDMVCRLHPDLVMMELLLPGVDGVTAAREIRRLQRDCKLLVLTGCKERRLLQAAWLEGIDACMTKDESTETLLAALALIGACGGKQNGKLMVDSPIYEYQPPADLDDDDSSDDDSGSDDDSDDSGGGAQTAAP